MGYVGLYSLGARCGSEAIATGLMIFLGEGTLANELLSKTKGHSMGFGWVRAVIAYHVICSAMLCRYSRRFAKGELMTLFRSSQRFYLSNLTCIVSCRWLSASAMPSLHP